MPIKREIYVTQKRLIAHIDVTYGTELIPIALKVMDYNLPPEAIATAYSIGKEHETRKRICKIIGNEISFTPLKGFFDEGANVLQIRVTYENKDLITFDNIVRCQRTIVKDDANEIQENSTLVQQLLSEVGVLSARLNEALNIPEGGTSADAALNDIKIGHDGEEYESPGDAVREQVKEVLRYAKQVENDVDEKLANSGLITNTVDNLINYYTKSETYTQEEINQLVSTIPKFSIQPVPELPTEDISTTTVYLLTTGEESQNLYTEYIYVNGAWEKLGTQKLDLSGYALKTDIPTKLSELINDTEFITAAVDNLVNYYTKKEMEERLYEKANSIITTRTGTVVATTDSAKAKPKNIRLYGKTEQPSTEGNQLLKNPENFVGVEYIKSGLRSDILLPLAGTYTMTFSFKDTSKNGFWCGFYDADGNFIKSCTNDTRQKSGNIDFTEDEISVITNIIISCNEQMVGQIADYAILNYGSVELPYETYTGGEASPNKNYQQPLNSHGDSGSIVGKVLTRNVFHFTEIFDAYEEAGVSIETESLNSFSYSGTLTDSCWIKTGYANRIGQRFYLPHGDYIVTFKDSGNHFNCNINGSFDNDTTNECSYVVLTKSGTYAFNVQKGYENLFFNIFSNKNSGNISGIVEIQIERDNTAHEIEPYTEQPFTALTPNGFMGLPVSEGGNCIINGQRYMSNVKDYESGENIQNVYKFRLTSDLTWAYTNTTNYKNHNFQIRLNANGFPKGYVVSNTISRAYLYATKLTHFRCKDLSFDNTGFGNEKVYVYGNELTVSFASDSEINSLAKWKQFLNDNEVYVEYILAEPIITDLTQEELDQYNALLMNYPNTTVVNDAGAYMEVEYVCDTQKHIEQNYISKEAHKEHENRIAELERAMANL